MLNTNVDEQVFQHKFMTEDVYYACRNALNIDVGASNIFVVTNTLARAVAAYVDMHNSTNIKDKCPAVDLIIE